MATWSFLRFTRNTRSTTDRCRELRLQLPWRTFSKAFPISSNPIATSAMTTSIKRIGVVLKPHQPDALKTICELVSGLAERNLTLVGGPEIERAAIAKETACTVAEVEAEKLAANVDLVLVLGGDGTMIAMSRMIGDTEVPVLGINYGGLGYLAEFRIEELYAALESILSGNYRLDKRVMLSVELPDAAPVSANRVLNDVVINKSALARIIE